VLKDERIKTIQNFGLFLQMFLKFKIVGKKWSS